MFKKKLVLAITLLSSTIAFAQTDADIYSALVVEEVNPHPGLVGAVHLEKAVGGLVCTKSTVVYPGAQSSYVCSLNEENNDAKEIYAALDAEEYDPSPGAVGAVNVAKSVGSLVCTKSTAVYPGAKARFSCQL